MRLASRSPKALLIQKNKRVKKQTCQTLWYNSFKYGHRIRQIRTCHQLFHPFKLKLRRRLKPLSSKISRSYRAPTTSTVAMLKCLTNYYTVTLTLRSNCLMPYQASKKIRKLADLKLSKPSKLKLLQCYPCRI